MRKSMVIMTLLAIGTSSYAQTPWLPKDQQEAMKAHWPEGVPFPETLKFYHLPKANQQIATTNDRPSRGFHSVSGINTQFPYIGSGGMDWAKEGTWRNVTGLAIPPGSKISVWTDRKPVLNQFGFYQYEEALFWSFPKGTQAFDVLFTKNPDGWEHIFNIRVRTKETSKSWDSGVSYFPVLDPKSGKMRSYSTASNSQIINVLKIERIKYKFLEFPPIPRKRYKFEVSSIPYSDGGNFFPPGFKGPGMSCNRCHVTAMSGEDAPYAGPELRGRDSVFSWYPTHVDSVDRDYFTPVLNTNWPLEVYR